MDRKKIYMLLALPLLLLVVGLAVIPGETRAIFLSEFKHRIAALFGNEPEPIGEELGLRLEHPEEYGIAEGDEGDIEDASSEEASDETADADSDSEDVDVESTDGQEEQSEPATPAETTVE